MRKSQQGFTLVEVVISLALGGLIISAIMSLFVSFVQVWQVKKTPYESFIEHVDNCTRFLYNRLNAIEVIPNKTASNTNNGSFHCSKLSANNAVLNGPWVLSMTAYKEFPFFYPSLTEQASIVHEMALVLTSSGLCFIFEAPEIVKQHLAEGVEYTDKTVKKYFILSPYVTSLEYAHFDIDKGQWTFTNSLEQYCKLFATKDFCQRPDGLRLKFKQESFEAERFIFINNLFLESVKEKTKQPQKRKEKNDRKK
jgi:prepilin-type N-terminal cleavage/methylation domain-containing protein